MKWLHDARTQIVHLGDLELRSSARVQVIAGWLPAPWMELDVPPLMPPDVIVSLLADQPVPSPLREEGVLRVERRWVASDLPELELLEACAHCYAVLDRVLKEAQGGVLPEPDAVRSGAAAPMCMLAGPDHRSSLLHLESGHVLVPEA